MNRSDITVLKTRVKDKVTGRIAVIIEYGGYNAVLKYEDDGSTENVSGYHLEEWCVQLEDAS